MVANRKYKEIYDMQANRRKVTWFNMQKLVVNYYALGILVLRLQHLLKVLTLSCRCIYVIFFGPKGHFVMNKYLYY
jgi:hypothetical protein